MRYLTLYSRLLLLTLLVMVGALSSHAGAETSKVTFWRLPEGALQPQAAEDSKGWVHLIYFQGDDKAGNLFYLRRSPDQAATFGPIRVNSEPNSAGAIGTVRTAQLAIGKDDRVHVVWNGLGAKAANGYPTAYQAYTWLNAAGTAFEPQRNLITWAKGLDGGGSVAADREGNVYVTWHAMAGARDEAGRAVFVAHSSDNGASFAREIRANPEPTGACACCGMRAFVDVNGVLYILYRAAGNKVNRDTMLLVSRDKGKTFLEKPVDRWSINACPMSTYALCASQGGILAAWETRGRVYHSTLDPADFTLSKPQPVFGNAQKHPFLVAGVNGQTLLVWTEGTGWQRGGTLAWQIYDQEGRPVANGSKAEAIPVWGLATAYARSDGSFVVIY